MAIQLPTYSYLEDSSYVTLCQVKRSGASVKSLAGGPRRRRPPHVAGHQATTSATCVTLPVTFPSRGKGGGHFSLILPGQLGPAWGNAFRSLAATPS
jgi:hypothetical protein